MDEPRHIRVKSKGFDAFGIKITDADGRDIVGVRSVTWRCRYPGTPTFVIEGDGLDLDVGGRLFASDDEERLVSIHNHILRAIQAREGEERAFKGHPAEHQASGALIELRALLSQFFGPAA